MHMHACIACVRACACVCACTCKCSKLCAFNTYMDRDTILLTMVFMLCTCKHIFHACAYVRVLMRLNTKICMYVHIREHMFTCMHVCTGAVSYTQTCMCIHMPNSSTWSCQQACTGTTALPAIVCQLKHALLSLLC